MKKRYLLIGLYVVLCTLLVSGCSVDTAAEVVTPEIITLDVAAGEEIDEPVVDMANPASVYCEEQGGRVDIRTAADGGQNGVCVFDDGECEEWAFFRGTCSVAVEPSSKLAYGWYGYVVTPSADQPFENYLVLMPEAVDRIGLVTDEPSIEAVLSELRDSDTLAHFWGHLNCAVANFDGCQLEVTHVHLDGSRESFKSPDLVEGWEGVLRTNTYDDPCSGPDDIFVLADGPFSVHYGLDSADADIRFQLDTLRNTESHFLVYGVLTCGVMDANGCQIFVDRIVTVDEVSGPPEIIEQVMEDCVGMVVGFDEMAQYDDYFQTMSQNGQQFGIEGKDALNEQIVALRDTGTLIHIWGIVRHGVPDAYGAQIQVTRIELE